MIVEGAVDSAGGAVQVGQDQREMGGGGSRRRAGRLTETGDDCGRGGQEEGEIAAQLRGEVDEDVATELQIEKGVKCGEHGGAVAGATGETGADGDSFGEFDVDGQRSSRAWARTVRSSLRGQSMGLGRGASGVQLMVKWDCRSLGSGVMSKSSARETVIIQEAMG